MEDDGDDDNEDQANLIMHRTVEEVKASMKEIRKQKRDKLKELYPDDPQMVDRWMEILDEEIYDSFKRYPWND